MSVLPRKTFDNVLALPEINWDRVSEQKKAQIADRCIELYQQLHTIDQIEGVKKFQGALYLYEQALMKAMDILGLEITNEEKDDLLIANFLG